QLESARRAVADERARIARELHDLVAHSMGVIVIQAQGAQRAIDPSPERAREALASIERAGRSGMAELRRLLGLLTETGDDADSTAPQPGLDQLPDLVDRVRATGLAVDLAVEGDVRPLPAGLELTGYRIVQEAITNVLKHAGATTVDVRVRYQPDSLDIDVRDHGRGSASAATNGGHGLVGMRERVGLYGGSVTAGPRPEGGFSVRARIPVDGTVS
ncbi:MAG: sensor histidine kinase, partial [Actinomycetota bacterium]|nr:sensor histidine kinase [Actinomycetota bacterium]